MATDFGRLAISALLAAALAGCATTDRTRMVRDNWGEANRQTMAAQIIDPAPQYDTAMTTSGDQVAGAIERYRTDKVKQPEKIKTSKVGAAGGSN